MSLVQSTPGASGEGEELWHMNTYSSQKEPEPVVAKTKMAVIPVATAQEAATLAPSSQVTILQRR